MGHAFGIAVPPRDEARSPTLDEPEEEGSEEQDHPDVGREAAQQHVAGLEQLAADYLGDRSTLRTITRDDLRDRLRDGDVVVLDVRPAAEYAAGHIRGAISVPVQDLKARLREIPDGADVVAYCRGPFCVFADDAVRLLTQTGVTAARLQDGFPEWAEAHLPVERS